ncbi:hypothetical protein Trydic_g21785 [Trypoxylus dichotomus]
MWFKLNFFVFFIVLLVQIQAIPFLKNPIRTISSSILSASIAQDNSNISDLRRRKSEKIQDLTKDGDGDDFNAEDEAFLNEKTPEDANEAIPNIFQKKIEKIMRKLHFVAQLISRFNSGGANDKPDDTNSDTDLDFDSDEDFEDDSDKGNSTETPISPARYFYEKSSKNKEEIDEKFASKQGDTEDDKRRNGATSPNGLGVHFMEILGSLFGLIYGAAIQLTNTTSSRPGV